MTAQQLTDTFIGAGFDTPEKVAGFLSIAKKQVELRAVDLQIEGLNKAQKDALYPIEQQRAALQTQRATLVQALS